MKPKLLALSLVALSFNFFSCSNFSKLVKSYRPESFYKGTIQNSPNDNFYNRDGSVNANSDPFMELLNEAEQDKAARNKLIGKCLIASEEIGSAHIAKIPAIQAAGNTLLGTGTNLFSGLATAINPASTKTALAATSTLFGATRELVNHEVYYNALAPVIVNKIKTKRATLRAGIETKLKEENINDYNVYAALADVAAYHEAASFYSGISDVMKDASRTDSLTQKINKLQQLKAAGLSSGEYEEGLKQLVNEPAGS